MRMSETLVLLPDMKGENCERQLTELCKITATSPTDWKLVIDSHQKSTREAGKSSCAFFVKTFATINEGSVMLHRVWNLRPNVNMELIVAPGGMFDHGDGPGVYQKSPHERACNFLPDHSYTVALLVDVQNLGRNL